MIEPNEEQLWDLQAETLRRSLGPLFEATMVAKNEGKLTKELFGRLAQLRLQFSQMVEVEQHRGAQHLLNTRIKPGPFELPTAYKAFEQVFAIRLLWSICKNPDDFDTYVHLVAMALGNAETAYQQQTPDDRQKEIWPPIGKRLQPNEPGYLDQVFKKCRILELLSRRYPLTHIENPEAAVLPLLAGTSSVSADERSLRKEVKGRSVKPLEAPTKRHTELAKRTLFPIQQEAFDGADGYMGITAHERERAMWGTLAKEFAVISPTGAGKTVIAAEIVARIYQRAIDQALEDQAEGQSLSEAPAVLFIAPQKSLANQSAQEFHAYLAGQYDIQIKSRIGMDGKIKETKWAFLDQSLTVYKAAVVALHPDSCRFPEDRPLAKYDLPQVQDRLLTEWENILQLSQYGNFSADLEIQALQKFALEHRIIKPEQIRIEFLTAVKNRVASVGDKAARSQKSEQAKIRHVQNLLHKTRAREVPETYTLSTAESLLEAEWDMILSPFLMDDEVNALRQICAALKIPIPPLYRDLFKLTLACQNGMIAKPDPKDYTNEHLDLPEREMRKQHPLEAAFCTIQGLYRKEGNFSKLESLLRELSGDGKRRIVVVCDEAHYYGSTAVENIAVLDYLKAHPSVDVILGITASDTRSDGEKVETHFGATVAKATLLKAVATGRLQQFTYVQPQVDTSLLDVDQVAQISGKKAEIAQERLSASIDDLEQRVRLIEAVQRGDTIDIATLFPGLPPEDQQAWVEGLKGKWSRNILGFCNDIASARFVTDELNRRGMHCAIILGDTSMAERAQIINDYKTGAIQALILVDVGRMGLDLPQTTVGVIFGSVGSPVTLQQMFGRFLRKRPGPPTLILDYAVPGSQVYHAQLLARQFSVNAVSNAARTGMRQAEENARKAGSDGGASSGDALLSTLSLFQGVPITFPQAEVYTSQAMELLKVQANEGSKEAMTDFQDGQPIVKAAASEKLELEQSLAPVNIEFVWPEPITQLVETLKKRGTITVEMKTNNQADGARLGFIEFSLLDDNIAVAFKDVQPIPGFEMARLAQFGARLTRAIELVQPNHSIATGWQVASNAKGIAQVEGSVYVGDQDVKDIGKFIVKGRTISLNLETGVTDLAETVKMLTQVVMSAAVAGDTEVTGWVDVKEACSAASKTLEFLTDADIDEILRRRGRMPSLTFESPQLPKTIGRFMCFDSFIEPGKNSPTSSSMHLGLCSALFESLSDSEILDKLTSVLQTILGPTFIASKNGSAEVEFDNTVNSIYELTKKEPLNYNVRLQLNRKYGKPEIHIQAFSEKHMRILTKEDFLQIYNILAEVMTQAVRFITDETISFNSSQLDYIEYLENEN